MTQFKSEKEIHDLWEKDGREVVLFEGVVYNVSDFKNKHPGGLERIETNFGKCIDEPFNEQLHSKYARTRFKKFPIVGYYSDLMAEKLTTEYDTAYKRSFFCSRKFIIKKLFTKEDPIQFHKTLGLLSLMSFFYRYAFVLPTRGNLGFDGTWFDHANIALHMLLSCSSLIFHVLRHRYYDKPLIIWEEYRLHAIVFTLRCISVYIFGQIWPSGQDKNLEHLVLTCLVLAHHLVVDEITRRVGPKNKTETTVRGKKNSNNRNIPTVVLRFYAFYQFSALGSHLLPNTRLSDLGYNALVAIQSSAFLMTLFRKGLIRHWTHAFWYSLALGVSLITMYLHVGGIWFWIRILAVYLMRVKLRMDKYVIWVLFAAVSMPVVQHNIFQKFGVANTTG